MGRRHAARRPVARETTRSRRRAMSDVRSDVLHIRADRMSHMRLESDVGLLDPDIDMHIILKIPCQHKLHIIDSYTFLESVCRSLGGLAGVAKDVALFEERFAIVSEAITRPAPSLVWHKQALDLRVIGHKGYCVGK